MSKIFLTSFLLLGCTNMSFGPVDWFNSHQQKVPVSATNAGDCTTDVQCQQLLADPSSFCYKDTSYVGQCVVIIN